MKILGHIIAFVTAFLLAASIAGAGLVVCVVPQVTGAFANVFVDDATSPFSRAQLVQVAEATRDYSFGAHSSSALYRTIYDVDEQYRSELEKTGGSVPANFPKFDSVTDTGNVSQLKQAFERASEMYCFSPETVAHLDDCHAVAGVAFPVLIVIVVLALAGLIFTGVMGSKRKVAAVFTGAGSIVLLVFIALGAWAVIDFNGLFGAFHGLFFKEGSWVFPYDSLLICALPGAFWMGMGVLWLAIAVLASILSIAIGRRLRK